jgi:GxxExxY protein
VSFYYSPAARDVIGSAIEVHRHLGPGLLESVYESCLCHELSIRDIAHRRQVPIPIEYKGLDVRCRYRVDLVVDDGPLVEVKAIETILPIHVAQVLTYLKLLERRHALLINFNVALLRNGIRSIVL